MQRRHLSAARSRAFVILAIGRPWISCQPRHRRARVAPATPTRRTIGHRPHCSAREGKAVDLKCKGPRFDPRGAPEGFSHTGQGKLFGLS
eukprot:6526238-Prymnesium_polylepis.1